MQDVKQMALTGLALFLVSCASVPASPSVSNQAPDTIRRHFVDGVYGQVHIRVATPPATASAKTPLILLHPTPYSSDYFKSFMPEMARDRLVIAIDTPGYGDSARPDSPPSITDYARNVLQVLNAAGIDEPVDVFGYHTGTFIAAEMAIINSARVRRLVLPSVPHYVGAVQKENFDKYAKPTDPLATDGSHLMGKWSFATGAIEDGMSLQRGQEHFSDAMQSMPYSSQAYFGVFSYPSATQFPKLTQLTLFMATNGSLKAETAQAKSLTPNAEIIYFDQFKHGIFDLGVAELAAETRAFLDN